MPAGVSALVYLLHKVSTTYYYMSGQRQCARMFYDISIYYILLHITTYKAAVSALAYLLHLLK